MSDYIALRDLGEIVEDTKNRISSEFTNEDVSLSKGFKKAFSSAISAGGNSIKYRKTTSVITTVANQQIFLPNQWFVLAKYAVDFISEIVRYRNITEAVLDANVDTYISGNDPQIKKKQKAYDVFKGENKDTIIDQFKADIIQFLHDNSVSDDQAETDAELLIKFVSDENWWLGGKNISRTNDFYVSPTLSILNLVNASQSYVANITWLYITNDSLASELGNMISMDADEEDEYESAAKHLQAYISKNNFVIPTQKSDVEAVLLEFNQKFSPSVLAALPDNELLDYMFYTVGDNTNSLCCWLEKNDGARRHFGSISPASSHPYGLFQHSKTGEWTVGDHPSNAKVITAQEALAVGRKIRDALVSAAQTLQTATLTCVEDYERLDIELQKVVAEKVDEAWSKNYYSHLWFHKYLSMVCPDKLCSYNSDDWQKHLLYALKIKPSEYKYARSGQLAMVENYANWYYSEFQDVITKRFGGDILQFVRIGTSDDAGNYADEWKDKSVVGIGWSKVGSLETYIGSDKKIDKNTLADALKIEYGYPTNLASRKAGELIQFYGMNAKTVAVAMNGETLIACIDNIGSYAYDGNSAMSNTKTGTWHQVFANGEKLPSKSEGQQTSCYLLKKEENLMFLYEKYYYNDDEIVEPEVNMPLKYDTNLKTEYERNRIVFGAPGTGKSFNLKRDCEECLKGTTGTFERVTFHPDYTYSQFVGTYKPISDGEKIRYEFVPGPFMRIYVEAMKSARSANPQPHILIIEEINRAKVAAVFGDVFQLLDRDDNGVSEYEIQTSEDVRKHLAKELQCELDECKKIKLPNNMFIWATMNSADQGVFPMDTAFKRRWNFEYLGINESQDKIKGRVSVGSAYSIEIEWNILRRAINEKLAKECGVNEDKLMGPFFISKNILKTISDGDDHIADTARFIDVFKSKVLMYLYEDAAKQHKAKLFSGCEDKTKYSAVCESFDEIGIRIFGDDFEENYYIPQKG